LDAGSVRHDGMGNKIDRVIKSLNYHHGPSAFQLSHQIMRRERDINLVFLEFILESPDVKSPAGDQALADDGIHCDRKMTFLLRLSVSRWVSI